MVKPSQPVLELRVALTAADYERSVNFYCDGLGLEPAAFWNNDGGRALMTTLNRVAATGVHVVDTEVYTPSLDDVFLKHTGHKIRSDAGGGDEMNQAMKAFMGVNQRR